MTADQVDLAGDLQEVCDLISGETGLDTTFDLNNVAVPGVWLRYEGHELDILGGYTMRGTAHIINRDGPVPTILGQLSTAYNVVKPHLPPTGLVDHIGLQLPDQGAPLPCLRYPFEQPCIFSEPPEEGP